MAGVNPPSVHECHCTYCWDFKLPAVVQRSGHIAFRFNDVRADIAITIDDQDVTDGCIEACPGVRGFVVLYRNDHLGARHFCETCHRHICMGVFSGAVRVTIGSEVFE